jgi:sulfate adenylyltransferase subunit 2
MSFKVRLNIKLLKELEAEAISIIWDSYSRSLNSALMYSIGKDSSVLLHLFRKAFYPGKIPIPLVHIDTKWKFKEMIEFKKKIEKKYNLNIITYTNPVSLNLDPQVDKNWTDIAKTTALKKLIENYNFDFLFGGARRDEEASRSKERIVSMREKNHTWNPKNQKPEIWDLFNFEKYNDQNFRIFPISNWTEADIWNYLYYEEIDIVNLYFSKKRLCVLRNGAYFVLDDKRFRLNPNEKIRSENIRFRTLGCYPLTAGIKSKAKNLKEVIRENNILKNSERAGRLIDLDKINSMELKKREGYF